MEAKDMPAPENLRRGILPTTVPTEERTASPVLPKPEARPSPEAPLQPGKHPKTNKPLIQRLARSLALRIALVGTALAGTGYVTYQEIPAVHRAVDRVIDLVNPPIETRFPNKLDSSNIEVMPQEELALKYNNSNPINIDGKKITLLFPFESEAIKSSPDLRYNKILGYIPPGAVNPEGLRDITHNIIQITGLPENATLYSPIDGSVFLEWLAGVKQGEGKIPFTSSYTYLRIVGRDSNGNQYELGISVLGGKPLTEFTPYPADVHAIPEMGTKINAGQPILQLPGNFSEAEKAGKALPNQAGQVIIGGFNFTDKVPLNLDFLTDEQNNILIGEKNTAK